MLFQRFGLLAISSLLVSALSACGGQSSQSGSSVVPSSVKVGGLRSVIPDVGVCGGTGGVRWTQSRDGNTLFIVSLGVPTAKHPTTASSRTVGCFTA